MFKPVPQRHEKVLIIAGGESLTGFDLDQTKDFDGVIITVNRVIEHIPRADYWMSVDLARPQKPLENMRKDCYYYAGYPVTVTEYNIVDGVHYLDKVVPKGDYSLQEDKNKITGGVDSVYGALNLAYHFEAKQISLLGVDCYGEGHWYDRSDPYNGYNLPDFKERFPDRIPTLYESCVKQFEKRGTEVINGSPESGVTCFKRVSPQEAYKMLI